MRWFVFLLIAPTRYHQLACANFLRSKPVEPRRLVALLAKGLKNFVKIQIRGTL
jgi:hypothetical protein